MSGWLRKTDTGRTYSLYGTVLVGRSLEREDTTTYVGSGRSLAILACEELSAYEGNECVIASYHNYLYCPVEER